MPEDKNRELIIPPVIGLIIAFTLLYIFTEIVNTFIYPGDGDDVFHFPYLTIYAMAFFPLLIFAGLVQYFIALPIWKIYTSNRKFLNLKLWQLILLSSIVFGIILAYWHWYTFQGLQMLVYYSISITIISISYWTVNLSVLKYLGNKQNGG